MLTLNKLKEMKYKDIIGTGVVHDNRLYEFPVRWVAIRGIIHDWALYYHLEDKSIDYVSTSGDKCFTEEVIRELVPCDDEAFKWYRY